MNKTGVGSKSLEYILYQNVRLLPFLLILTKTYFNLIHIWENSEENKENCQTHLKPHHAHWCVRSCFQIPR